jgi:hypothetical protein
VTGYYRVHGRAVVRRHPRGPQRNGPLTTTRVHPDALALALILADSNPARLRFLSTTQVLVVNRPRKVPVT